MGCGLEDTGLQEWRVAESKVITEHHAIALPGWVEYCSYKGLPRWLRSTLSSFSTHLFKGSGPGALKPPVMNDPFGRILAMEFSRQEYWMGGHSLLQVIFPTQGSNLGLLSCRQILYHLSPKGSPYILTEKPLTLHTKATRIDKWIQWNSRIVEYNSGIVVNGRIQG